MGPTKDPSPSPTEKPSGMPSRSPTLAPTNYCSEFGSQEYNFANIGTGQNCRKFLPPSIKNDRNYEFNAKTCASPYLICMELIAEYKNHKFTVKECQMLCAFEQRCVG